MSNRGEIKDGLAFDTLRRGIIYTEVLGWVDMGHARGDDIVRLRNQFYAGERSGKEYYSVMYRQDMNVSKFGHAVGIGKFSCWEIKQGRSREQINRIMLAMVMTTAMKFENLQSLKYFSWYTDSGFSSEDLVSDLFGFYRVMIPGLYRERVRPVGYDSAVRRWDYYGAVGAYKNTGFCPIIFPNPDDLCLKHMPYKATLPRFMTWIKPWNDFSSGVVRVITNDGNAFKYRMGR